MDHAPIGPATRPSYEIAKMADLSGSRERRRLFIGGLHESVSEEDISKRFNVYGNVISVQKVTRPPSDVFPGAGRALVAAS